MCTVCGSTNCNGNSRTRTKIIKVYGDYYQFSTHRKYLGSVSVNDWDDEKTIRRKILEEYPDAEIYD